jgi:predicted DNA-binding transcriptional regulator AlpA
MEKATDNVDRVRNRKQTADRLGICVRTLVRMEQRGEAPPRIKITNTLIGYRDSDIDRFLAARTVT